MNLTPREYEVARLFALGLTWREVMTELGISRWTLTNHRFHAVAKAGGGSLVDVWRGLGWLRVPEQMRASDVRLASACSSEPAPSLRRTG